MDRPTETGPGSASSPAPSRLLAALPPLGVFLAAAAARLVCLLQYRASPLFGHPVLDARFFHRLASGDLAFPRTAYQWNPLYPLFLEAVYGVAGPRPAAALAVQALMGAANALLVYFLARRLFRSAAAAIAAGALAALYGPFLFYDALLLPATLATFLVLLFLHAWTLAPRLPALHLPAGALLALAALARGNLVAFLPVAALWPLAAHRGQTWRTRLARSGLFLLGAALPLGAAAARNWHAERDLVLLTAHGGVNFYIGNGPGATGLYRPALPGPHGLEGQMRKTRELVEKEKNRPVRSSEVSGYFYDRAFDHMLRRPAAWLRGLGRRILLLLNGYEPPLNYNYDFYRRHVVPFLGLPLPGFALILLLAGAGAALSLLGGPPGSRAPLAFAAACAASIAAFYVTSRYRIPLAAVLLPYAGYGLAGSLRAFRERELSRLTLALGAAALLAPAVFLPVKRHDFSDSFRALGSAHAAGGNLSAAEDALRRSWHIDPSSSATANNLGNVLRDRGRTGEAEAWFRRAIDRDAANAQAWNNLGVVLQERGDLFGAEEAFLTAHRLAPRYATPVRNLARLYRRQGLAEEADRLWKSFHRGGG